MKKSPAPPKFFDQGIAAQIRPKKSGRNYAQEAIYRLGPKKAVKPAVRVVCAFTKFVSPL